MANDAQATPDTGGPDPPLSHDDTPAAPEAEPSAALEAEAGELSRTELGGALAGDADGGPAGGGAGEACQADLDAQSPAPAGTQVELPDFRNGGGRDRLSHDIDLLGDGNLEVKIELGRTRMFVEDVLKLNEGSVVELDKLAGDPVDVLANGRLIARGEVLVLNDTFCVRVSEIISGQQSDR